LCTGFLSQNWLILDKARAKGFEANYRSYEILSLSLPVREKEKEGERENF
jgi:hypothetical protein